MPKGDSILGQITPAQENTVKEFRMKKADGSFEEDPTLVVTKQPSGDMTHLGHLLLTIVFYSALVVYIIAETVAFVTAKPMTKYAQRELNLYAPLPIEIHARCLPADPLFGCGTMTLRANLTNYPGNPCYDAAPLVRGDYTLVAAAPALALPSVTLPMCHVRDEIVTTSINGPLAINGVSISFANLSAGSTAVIEVRARHGGMQRIVNLGPTNVRTLVLGAQVSMRDGNLVTAEPFGVQTQLEGFRKDDRGDVLIRFNQMANLKEEFETRTWLNLFAGIGNAFTLLGVLFVVIVPVFQFIFSKKAPEEGEEDRAQQPGETDPKDLELTPE